MQISLDERKSTSDNDGYSTEVPFIKTPRTIEVGLALEEETQDSNETETCAFIETENASELDKENNSDDKDQPIVSPAINDTDPLGTRISGVIEEEKMKETLKDD